MALTSKKDFWVARTVGSTVPDERGIYGIRMTDAKKLPDTFDILLSDRKHRTIYVGIASKSLKERLNQELRGKGHGTFFRSIGAILGFRPERGSLREKKNKRNYKFKPEDQTKIIKWIDDNLEIKWVPLGGELKDIEKKAIHKIQPLLNIQNNPKALRELKELRAECVGTASEPRIEKGH